MTDMLQIQRMTIVEYRLRMTASQLRKVDEAYDQAMQSWFNRKVTITDADGMYVYTDFDKFFNYLEMEQKILHPIKSVERMDQDLVRIAKRLQKYNEGRKING